MSGRLPRAFGGLVALLLVARFLFFVAGRLAGLAGGVVWLFLGNRAEAMLLGPMTWGLFLLFMGLLLSILVLAWAEGEDPEAAAAGETSPADAFEHISGESREVLSALASQVDAGAYEDVIPVAEALLRDFRSGAPFPSSSYHWAHHFLFKALFMSGRAERAFRLETEEGIPEGLPVDPVNQAWRKSVCAEIAAESGRAAAVVLRFTRECFELRLRQGNRAAARMCLDNAVRYLTPRGEAALAEALRRELAPEAGGNPSPSPS